MWILTNEDPAASPQGGADPAAAAAAGAAAVAPEGGAAPGGDKLIQPPAAGEGGQPPDPNDWMPEKFRVVREDGSFDEAASARKLAGSYVELEKMRGEPAPAKPEDYKLEAPVGEDGKPVEGVDFEAFKADPLCQSFLKAAHAKGMTNAQVNFAISEYVKLAPQLAAADAQLTAAQARTELGKLWTDPAILDGNLRKVSQAIQGFGGEADDMPGSRARLFEKFGSDPDFIAFAAAVAGEMGEDKLPAGGTVTGEQEIEALMKGKAYWDQNDPQHAATKAKVEQYFARKHGAARK